MCHGMLLFLSSLVCSRDRGPTYSGRSLDRLKVGQYHIMHNLRTNRKPYSTASLKSLWCAGSHTGRNWMERLETGEMFTYTLRRNIPLGITLHNWVFSKRFAGELRAHIHHTDACECMHTLYMNGQFAGDQSTPLCPILHSGGGRLKRFKALECSAHMYEYCCWSARALALIFTVYATSLLATILIFSSAAQRCSVYVRLSIIRCAHVQHRIPV